MKKKKKKLKRSVKGFFGICILVGLTYLLFEGVSII